MPEIVASISPGGVRADVDTLSGVGRDGRAITAGIAPSTADRFFDLADTYLQLERDRLVQADLGKDPRGSNRTSIQTTKPRQANVAVPSTPGIPDIFGQNKQAFLIIGAVIAVVIVVALVKKR